VPRPLITTAVIVPLFPTSVPTTGHNVALLTISVAAGVLLDLRMPRLDGVEATRRILAALRAGALGYLTKDAGREQIARDRAQAVRYAYRHGLTDPGSTGQP
jgi:CheY-like chemotaxis protein